MIEGLPHGRPRELHRASVPVVAEALACATRALWRGGVFRFEDVGLCSRVVFLLGPSARQLVVTGYRPPGRLSHQVILGAHGHRLGKHGTLASTHFGVAVATPVPHPLVITPPPPDSVPPAYGHASHP